MPAVVGDDGDRFPVETGQSPRLGFMARRMKRHAVADLEAEHFLVRTDLSHETQPLYDFVVEFDEFGLGEVIDREFHFITLSIVPTVSAESYFLNHQFSSRGQSHDYFLIISTVFVSLFKYVSTSDAKLLKLSSVGTSKIKAI